MWSIPATKLSKEFGISDVALGKICKKLNIPKPYPGYWQQLAAGQHIQKEKLPPIKNGIPAMISISPHKSVAPFKPKSPKILAQLKRENQEANKITVEEILRNSHPLIRYTRQILEKSKPDDYGRLRWSGDEQCLDVYVSKTMLHRTLTIMDTLLKAMEVRGYSIEVSKNFNSLMSTYILIGKEKVQIRLSENSNRSERELTEEEKKQPSFLILNKWIYTPGGKLTFEINHYIEGLQKRWTDRARIPLQEQLNEIVKGIILTGEALRLKSIEREKEEHKKRKQELQRLEEQKRREYLNKHCEAWAKSQQLREFICACEKSLIDRKGELAPNSPEAQWLRWAYQYADRIDPLKNGSFEESISI